MKKLPAWLTYTLLRVGLVIVLLVILILLGVNPFLATALAVILALPISYLALDRQRRAFSQEIAERRAHPERARTRRPGGHEDEDVEDAVVAADAETDLVLDDEREADAADATRTQVHADRAGAREAGAGDAADAKGHPVDRD